MSPSTSARLLRAFARAQRTIPRSLLRAPAASLRPATTPPQVACLRSQFHTISSRAKKNKTNEYEGGTDFEQLDVLGGAPTPSTSIDVCMSDGFSLNSGVKILDGNGALLVGGEAFEWRPWEAKGSMNLINAKGQFELPAEVFGVLELLWPRPDLLILGVGPKIVPLAPATKKHLSSIGIRVDVLDTGNAASQFNLLATERGVDDVAAALIPLGWVEGKGAA